MKLGLFFLLITVVMASSFRSRRMSQESSTTLKENSFTSDTEIIYSEFKPKEINNFNLEGYQVDYAYEIESNIIISAYSEGDSALSGIPSNWGDRLIIMRGNKILFESNPVGEVYQYEPHFFQNNANDKIVVICQIGNEDHEGGEAFIMIDGSTQSIGKIEFENPLDTDSSNSLIDIIKISENEKGIFFKFNSDSLIYVGNNDYSTFPNNNTHYRYSKKSFELIGFDK